MDGVPDVTDQNRDVTGKPLCRNCFKPGGGLFSVPLRTVPGPKFIMSRFKFCSLECQRGYVLYHLQNKNVNSVACLHMYLVAKSKLTLNEIESCQPRDPESFSDSTVSDGTSSSAWRCRNCSLPSHETPFQFAFSEVLEAKDIGVAKKERFPTYPLMFCGPDCTLTYLLYSWTAFPWVSDLFLQWFSQRFPEKPVPKVLQDPEFLTVFTGEPGISMDDYHSEQMIQLVENGGYSQVCMNKYTMKHVIHNVKWEMVDGVEQCTISDITNVDATGTPPERPKGKTVGSREGSEGTNLDGNQKNDQTGDVTGTGSKSVDHTQVHSEDTVRSTPKLETMPVVSFSDGTNPVHPEETFLTPEFFSIPRKQNQVLEEDQWRTQYVGRSANANDRPPTKKRDTEKLHDLPEKTCVSLSETPTGTEIPDEEEGFKRAEFLGFDVM